MQTLQSNILVPLQDLLDWLLASGRTTVQCIFCIKTDFVSCRHRRGCWRIRCRIAEFYLCCVWSLLPRLMMRSAWFLLFFNFLFTCSVFAIEWSWKEASAWNLGMQRDWWTLCKTTYFFTGTVRVRRMGFLWNDLENETACFHPSARNGGLFCTKRSYLYILIS